MGSLRTRWGAGVGADTEVKDQGLLRSMAYEVVIWYFLAGALLRSVIH